MTMTPFMIAQTAVETNQGQGKAAVAAVYHRRRERH